MRDVAHHVRCRGQIRRSPLVGPRDRRRGAIHFCRRCVCGECRDPLDPRRSAGDDSGNPRCHRPLSDRLRDADHHRRPTRRHSRRQAGIPCGGFGLHPSIAMVRPIAFGRRAGRCARRAGCGCGADDPAGAGDHPPAVSRRRARPRLWHLRVHARFWRRSRVRPRRLVGRSRCRWARLAYDLLCQRADRRCADGRRLAADACGARKARKRGST